MELLPCRVILCDSTRCSVSYLKADPEKEGHLSSHRVAGRSGTHREAHTRTRDQHGSTHAAARNVGNGLKVYLLG